MCLQRRRKKTLLRTPMLPWLVGLSPVNNHLLSLPPSLPPSLWTSLEANLFIPGISRNVLFFSGPNHQRIWKLRWNILCTHLAPICMLSQSLLAKFLHQSLVGSLLSVRCWLGPLSLDRPFSLSLSHFILGPSFSCPYVQLHYSIAV